MGTREMISKTIDEMLERGDKLNIYAVAERCGISHSLIYNRYPDLKERIKDLKKVQRAKADAKGDAALITKLLDKNKSLEAKVNAEDSAKYEAVIAGLVAHLHQVYAMYDQLLEDRNKLAERLRNHS